MKFKNFTIYFFAVIGFVVIACSAAATADDNPVDNPPIVQSNIGKYQIAQSSKATKADSTVYLAVINTETGVMKSYKKNADTAWEELTIAAITFTH